MLSIFGCGGYEQRELWNGNLGNRRNVVEIQDNE